MIKDPNVQLFLLEDKLQIDYSKEVEEDYLFTKNELDCLEKSIGLLACSNCEEKNG